MFRVIPRPAPQLAVVASDLPETPPPAAPAVFPEEPGDHPGAKPPPLPDPKPFDPAAIPNAPVPLPDTPAQPPPIPTTTPLAARLDAVDEALGEVFEARMQANRYQMALSASLLGLSCNADWAAMAVGDIRPEDVSSMRPILAPLSKSLRDLLHKLDLLHLEIERPAA